MFSKALSPSFPERRIAGYSLVELLASLVLIVLIAVLALPTYQDFEPHSETLEAGSMEGEAAVPPADGAPVAPDTTTESAEESRSGNAAKEPEFDAGDALADS